MDQLAKSAEAYQGSALGWLRSRVPDRYLKAQEAYTQKAVDFFYSIKVDDAVVFIKEKSAQGYKIVTEVRAGPRPSSVAFLRASASLSVPRQPVRLAAGAVCRLHEEQGEPAEGHGRRDEDRHRRVDDGEAVGVGCASCRSCNPSALNLLIALGPLPSPLSHMLSSKYTA